MFTWKNLFSKENLLEGEKYSTCSIKNLSFKNNFLTAIIFSEGKHYLQIDARSNKISCSCSYFQNTGKACKHMVPFLYLCEQKHIKTQLLNVIDLANISLDTPILPSSLTKKSSNLSMVNSTEKSVNNIIKKSINQESNDYGIMRSSEAYDSWQKQLDRESAMKKKHLPRWILKKLREDNDIVNQLVENEKELPQRELSEIEKNNIELKENGWYYVDEDPLECTEFVDKDGNVILVPDGFHLGQ